MRGDFSFSFSFSCTPPSKLDCAQKPEKSSLIFAILYDNFIVLNVENTSVSSVQVSFQSYLSILKIQAPQSLGVQKLYFSDCPKTTLLLIGSFYCCCCCCYYIILINNRHSFIIYILSTTYSTKHLRPVLDCFRKAYMILKK